MYGISDSESPEKKIEIRNYFSNQPSSQLTGGCHLRIWTDKTPVEMRMSLSSKKIHQKGDYSTACAVRKEKVCCPHVLRMPNVTDVGSAPLAGSAMNEMYLLLKRKFIRISID